MPGEQLGVPFLVQGHFSHDVLTLPHFNIYNTKTTSFIVNLIKNDSNEIHNSHCSIHFELESNESIPILNREAGHLAHKYQETNINQHSSTFITIYLGDTNML